MAVPKERKSRSKRDMRRANHDRMTLPNASACDRCGEAKLPHRVCPSCGHYAKREIFAQPAPEAAK